MSGLDGQSLDCESLPPAVPFLLPPAPPTRSNEGLSLSETTPPVPPPRSHDHSFGYFSKCRGSVEVQLDEEAKKEVSQALNRYMSEKSIDASIWVKAETLFDSKNITSTDKDKSLSEHIETLLAPVQSTAEVIFAVETEQANKEFDSEFPEASLALLDRYMSHASFSVDADDEDGRDNDSIQAHHATTPATEPNDTSSSIHKVPARFRRTDSGFTYDPSSVKSVVGYLRSKFELYFPDADSDSEYSRSPQREQATGQHSDVASDVSTIPFDKEKKRSRLAHHIKEMFHEIDLNRTGFIDQGEFEGALEILNIELDPQCIDLLFQTYANSSSSNAVDSSNGLTLQLPDLVHMFID